MSLAASRRHECAEPGCWKLKELGDTRCLAHSKLVRYEIRAVVICNPRIQEIARRREPTELGRLVMEGLTMHGFHIVGDVSVRNLKGTP